VLVEDVLSHGIDAARVIAFKGTRVKPERTRLFVRVALDPWPKLGAARVLPATGHHDGFENTFDSARSDALHRSSTCRASREVRLAASANQMTLFTLIYLASVPIHTYRTMRRVLVERRRHLACLAFFGTTAASSRAARSGFKPDASKPRFLSSSLRRGTFIPFTWSARSVNSAIAAAHGARAGALEFREVVRERRAPWLELPGLHTERRSTSAHGGRHRRKRATQIGR